MVEKALKAAEKLKEKNIDARILNLHTPKPIDAESIIKAAKETGAILTAEEHTVQGGMGSAVAEVVVGSLPVPMEIMGVRDEFGVSGEPEELFEYYGLTTDAIVKKAETLLARK
jgi:transketolase